MSAKREQMPRVLRTLAGKDARAPISSKKIKPATDPSLGRTDGRFENLFASLSSSSRDSSSPDRPSARRADNNTNSDS
jgi:hypothetical protein